MTSRSPADSTEQLAQGLTHEINNPLAILLANLEFATEELEARGRAAAEDGGPDEVRQALAEALQAGRRISIIILELMAFARGRRAADRGPADLVEVLGHARRLAEPEVRRHATFEVDLPRGPVMVRGNPARLGQVFLELLIGASSAVARTGRRDGRISLVVTTDPNWAVVEVRDDGAPIPAELRPHVFDPFVTPTAGFAVGSAGLRGAGMGLPACLGVIRGAGGTLELVATAGPGTLFRARLRAADAESRTVVGGEAPPFAGGRRRVLVVDVDPFTCASAYRALSGHFDVAPHTSVESALADIRASERFDLMLCDPGSGLAVVEALAAGGAGQAARVVLVGNGNVGGTPPGSAGPLLLLPPITVDRVLEILQSLGEGKGPLARPPS